MRVVVLMKRFRETESVDFKVCRFCLKDFIIFTIYCQRERERERERVVYRKKNDCNHIA